MTVWGGDDLVAMVRFIARDRDEYDASTTRRHLHMRDSAVIQGWALHPDGWSRTRYVIRPADAATATEALEALDAELAKAPYYVPEAS